VVKELTKNFKRGGKLHHAYLIEGEREAVLPELSAFIERELNMPVRGNPDVQVLEYESFGIDEGRYIQGLESTTAVGKEERRIFVIAFNFITHQAQNAFLKLFEEPNPGTHFFLITRSAEVLLPTLRSRLQIIRHRVSNNLEERELAEKFLKTAPGKRIDLFKKIIDAKDKAAAISFLNDLEVKLHAREDFFNPTNSSVLEEIIKARSYLHDSGASLKMLLEHIALAVPTK